MPIFFHARSTDFGAYEQARVQTPTLRELFEKLETPDSVLELIPPRDRWDMYFSLAETRTPRRQDGKNEQRGTWARENWIRQEVLGWDLDAIHDDDLDRYEDYMAVMSEYLGIPDDTFTVIRSGHGFQFLVFLDRPIDDFEFFEKNRPLYRAGLEEIRGKLRARGLSGDPDHRVFDYARIFRLPGTENRKREPHVPCRLIQTSLVKHSINLAELLDIPAVAESEALTDQEMTQIHRAIDVPTVLSECRFLTWTREEPLNVKEPEGYAALSVLGRLDKDFKLAREYYKLWKNSSSLQRQDPTRKIEQAITASGPRTCASIHAMWGQGPGCASCPHFGKIKSPILLTGEDFIATAEDGFYFLVRDKAGNVKDRSPAYDDLLKAYTREKNYFSQPETQQIWSFTGTHYVREHDTSIEGWCESVMKPKPKNQTRKEFLSKIYVNRLKPQRDFEPLFQATLGKINLKNGVLDAQTRTLSPHTPELGFKYVLPYDYDPDAKAPNFEQFLHTLTLGRRELIDTLLDFLGYCLWPGYEGIEPAFWWLSGEGSNGKSRFIAIAEHMLGGLENAVHLKPRNFKETDRFALGNLEGKLLCVVEEVNEKFLGDDMLGVIKDLCAGGTITVEAKGMPHWNMRNTAKFIFTSNKQPVLEDVTKGLQRRFIAVPFDKDFDAPGVHKDPNIIAKLLPELPGILNLALGALGKMVERGRRPFIPEAARKELERMVLASDSVERWIRDRVAITGNELDFITSKELFADYLNFLEGDRPVSQTTFGGRVRKKLPDLLRDKHYKKINGLSQRGYFGLAFKSPLSAEF